MPKIVRLLLLLSAIFFIFNKYAWAQTPPKTIHLGTFPIPTKSPTPTPSVNPQTGGNELCTTSHITECKKACNNPGAVCGTGGTGAVLHWCTHSVTVCTGNENLPPPILPTIPQPTMPPVATNPVIPTSPVVTAVPTILPTIQPVAYSAIDLISQITRFCGGRITSANLACIQSMTFPAAVDYAVKEELELSSYGEGWLQCVGLARAAVARAGHDWQPMYGNAIDYSTTVRPPGYTFIRKSSGVRIAINDVPVWNYDTVGHIAFVTRIYDSINFQVAEANYGCGIGNGGCARLFSKTTDEPALVGWLRKV